MDKCPYCNQELEKSPIRKSKCPHCKNIIYIKRRPDEEDNKLVTEQDAEKIDILWKEKNKKDYENKLINKLFSVLDYLEFPMEAYQTYKNLEDPNGNDFDILVKLTDDYYKVLVKNNKKINYQNIKFAYGALSFYAAENNLPYFELQKKSVLFELYNYQSTGVVSNVQILTAGNTSCDKCKQLEGKIYSIDDAIKIMPIPVKNCETDYYKDGWCRCTYLPIVDD